MSQPCEICIGYNGVKREDNIYVCDFCDDVYPISEFANDEEKNL